MTKTIEFQGLGKVKNIDFVEKMGKNGKIYNSAFVHFEYWYDNVASIHFQERVKNPDKEAKIIYRDPWFWACFENKGKKQIPGERKERINLTNLYQRRFETAPLRGAVVQTVTGNLVEVSSAERIEIFNGVNDLSNVFEEEKNDLQLPQEIEDKLERQLLDEFGCTDSESGCESGCDMIPYQKEKLSNVDTEKKQINMDYIRHLEMLNYKLIHDLYELRGDFISTF